MSVQYGTCARPPHRTPVAVHAVMLHNFLRDGAWFPKGAVYSARQRRKSGPFAICEPDD